jgi:NADH-quinone oxidoreductase subunit F
MCYREPLVEIIDDTGSYLYGEIDDVKITEIIEKHIKTGEPVKEYIVKTDLFENEDDSYWKNQVKIALRNCGVINPEVIEEYKMPEVIWQ